MTTQTNDQTQPKSTEALIQQLQQAGFSLDDAVAAIKEAKKQEKKKSTRKFDAIDYESLVLDLANDPTDEAWDLACDHVNMPVKVAPGQVVLNEGDDPINTEYNTDSGRNGTYHFVMIDRFRDGVWKALSPVSDMYAAIAPDGIYRNLQQTLDGIGAQYTLRQCYNSYSGGEHHLNIQITSIKGVNNDELTMNLLLITSLDRSKKHTLIAQPVMPDGTPIYFVDTGNNQFNLATRHVQSAAEKVVDFNASVGAIIENWNEKIIPYTMFLCDEGFSEKEVYALLSGIVKDAKLPTPMVEKMPLIKQNACGSVPINGIKQICAAIEDDESLSPMARAKHAENIGKAVAKRVGALFERKAK